ncbi:MAG TPA: zinc transporter ZupT [Synergistales bacterium]|nr:zinc transporter ZupT [Synergistaceae bacterium]HQO83504.1 zinc transporter ZupT [Synergistales bacterium]HQQ10752.1 zinc transporter ZupT [Synergistales bacterium]
MNDVLFAFGLTLLAGMATGIGSVIAFFADRTNYRFLSVSTGFSAGVMIYVSFVEIFFKGSESLAQVYGEGTGEWINTAFFFGGIALIAAIDHLIPPAENPHEPRTEEETAPLHGTGLPSAQKASSVQSGSNDKSLMRTGLFTALAIGIHNFPEGLVTFLAALQDPKLGVAIAIAIALHNIPEGISVSVPIFYATGKRSKAFTYSLLSGMAEPVGAIMAYGALRLFTGGGEFPPAVTGALFAVVAGIMVYISLDELLPTSRAYGKGHDSLIGLVTGMAVMALSLLLL